MLTITKVGAWVTFAEADDELTFPSNSPSGRLEYNLLDGTFKIRIEDYYKPSVALAGVTIGGVVPNSKSQFYDQWALVFPNAGSSAETTVETDSTLTGDGSSGTPLGVVLDSTHRFTTDAEKAAWNAKQAALVSGTNIKTINGTTVLGSGDLTVGGSSAWGGITGTLNSQTDLQAALDAKQASIGFTPENVSNKDIDGTLAANSDTKYPSQKAVKTYADSLVVGLIDDRGNYDASGNTFPASGGSGSSGAILKGDLWYISVAGTLGGLAVSVGSSVRALVDTPGQTAGNWDILNVGLGYVPENSANKDATGGYAGLTLFKINFKNVLNTFISFFTNSNTAARTYTFQDRNGTIADDTDLSLKFNKAGDDLTGTAGAGYVGLIPQSSNPSTPASGVKLFARATGAFSWLGTNGFRRSFIGTGITADRDYTLPDTSGTLLVTGRTAISDANYTILPTDKEVALTAITAARVFTLPAANSVNPGYELFVIDESGSVSTTLTLTIQRAGSDVINGATTEVITSPYGYRRFVSDGTSKWFFDGSLVRLNATQTLNNKAITKRVTTITSSATPSPSASTDDLYVITALAASATFASPGTGTAGQELMIRVKDNGSAQVLAWNAIYRASADLPLPLITIAGKTLYLKFIYNITDSKWDMIGLLNNF